MAIFSVQLRRTYSTCINTLVPELTPREKTEFDVIHIPMKKMLYVSSNQNGTHL